MTTIERVFESLLWNSRYVVLLAVVSSIAASLAVFWVVSVDVYYAVAHLFGYADPSPTEDARKAGDAKALKSNSTRCLACFARSAGRAAHLGGDHEPCFRQRR
jgi:Uncharacterized protein family, UPF0114